MSTIVAELVEGQALAALIMNTVRGSMKVAAVKAPGYGQERRNVMSDLCISTGANFISRDSGKKLSETKLSDLGSCKKVEVLKNQTTFVGGSADWKKIDETIEALRTEIKQTESMDECRRLQQRITRLNSGVAIIKVGAPTEVEMIEKKHRVEDALEAVRSAQSEGIVPGGGASLIHCQDFKIDAVNEGESLGASIIRQSLEAPARQIAENADQSADMILYSLREKSESFEFGWDFVNNKMDNMFSAGIVDPAKVTRVALQNAVSVASTLITTSNAVVEE